jgi:squalene-associated FAD-dependent desaturase
MMRVAVVGAGWAGCAAAVALAERGCAVTVFEAAAVPGGRARRVVRDGMPLDNGQHLLLGAYEQVRAQLTLVHGGDGERGVLARTPLAVVPAGEGFALRSRRLPAPFGLAAGLLRARGMSLSDRFATARWFARLHAGGFRVPPGTTVAKLCATGPRAAERALWAPLCLAALNTAPERACAQVFANVLRAAFAADGGASDYLIAATDLTALYPEAALRLVAARGGSVRLRTAARVAAVADDAVSLDVAGSRERRDAVVVAVGPHQLASAIGDVPALAHAAAAAAQLDYEPIATAWLGYGAPVALPAPIMRLDDAPGQWAFDRPDVLARATPDPSRPALAQLVSMVISASGPHDALAAPELGAACDAQLRRLLPGLPPLAWSQAFVERRATYACTPDRAHAPSLLPHPRAALAGDWTDAEYPATLEAAVRSGLAAARALAA